MLERLSYLGNTTTLGCELQFVQMNTLQVLADPIQHALSTNQRYYVIAGQCMAEAEHKGQLKGKVKAIRALRNRNDPTLPPFALKSVMHHEEIPCWDVHLARCLLCDA